MTAPPDKGLTTDIFFLKDNPSLRRELTKHLCPYLCIYLFYNFWSTWFFVGGGFFVVFFCLLLLLLLMLSDRKCVQESNHLRPPNSTTPGPFLSFSADGHLVSWFEEHASHLSISHTHSHTTANPSPSISFLSPIFFYISKPPGPPSSLVHTSIHSPPQRAHPSHPLPTPGPLASCIHCRPAIRPEATSRTTWHEPGYLGIPENCAEGAFYARHGQDTSRHPMAFLSHPIRQLWC